MRRAALILLLTITTRAQFQIQQSHTTASLRGIHAVNDQIAWASGTNGTVLHTTDGGTTWLPCTTPPDADKLDFRGIQAFDAQTAIVMSSGKGDLSRLYKTTDACKSWKLIFTNPDKEGFWDAIEAASDTEVWILGDSVKSRTRMFDVSDIDDRDDPQIVEDWYEVPADEEESSFAASNSLLISAPVSLVKDGWQYNRWWVSGTATHNYIHIIRDETNAICEPCVEERKRIEVPLSSGTASRGTFSISLSNTNVLVAVGGDYTNSDSSSKTAAYSTDYGFTWYPAQTPPHGYRSAVAYDQKSKTWITVGPNGTDISTDDGKNWSALKPTPGEAPDSDKNWNALSLPFVVGPNGRIGKLTSGAP